jgi:hypothetical protein
MAVLRCEVSSFGYTVQEQRLLARFPCNAASSSARRTPSLTSPESPRKTSDVSPRPGRKIDPSLWQNSRTVQPTRTGPPPRSSRRRSMGEGGAHQFSSIRGWPQAAMATVPIIMKARGERRKTAISSDLRSPPPDLICGVPPFHGGALSDRARWQFPGILPLACELARRPWRYREMLCGTTPDNKTERFAGSFLSLEPSDGLEPSTPSLPWRFRGGTGGHGRASAVTFFLQNRALTLCRECPRVPARAQADVPVSYPRVVVCS